jgi:hypothetical protein
MMFVSWKACFQFVKASSTKKKCGVSLFPQIIPEKQSYSMYQEFIEIFEDKNTELEIQ